MASIFKYKSNLSTILKDIKDTEKNRVQEAAKLVRKNMRKMVTKKLKSSPGMPPGLYRGNLKKGIAYSRINEYTYDVGFKAPAYHAHILEFGTRVRRGKDGKSRGEIKPRPFFRPTLELSKPGVKHILEEKIF